MGSGRDGTLHIRFEVTDDALRIRGTGRFAADPRLRTQLTDMSRMILETVVDDAKLEQLDGTPTFDLVKRK
jgi:hypothetical protein